MIARFSASMGPRLGSRGRLLLLKSPGLGRSLLQWGHGSEAVEDVAAGMHVAAGMPSFNGATARKPWKTRRRHEQRTGDTRDASMGPRLGSRGRPRSTCGKGEVGLCFNGATARKPWKTPPRPWSGCSTLRASMGPRLGSRGRRTGTKVTTLARASFNGATARKPWKTRLAGRS